MNPAAQDIANLRVGAAQDIQNEGRPLDQNIFATKLDLANLRIEFKDEISTVKEEISAVNIALARLETKLSVWGVVVVGVWSLAVAVLSVILKGVI